MGTPLKSLIGYPEEEKSRSPVRAANLCRREKFALHAEAKPRKVTPDPRGAAGVKDPFDVLDKDEPCAGLDEDPAGVGP